MKIVTTFYLIFLIFYFNACEFDHSLFNPEDLGRYSANLNLSTSAFYITSFDAYSSNSKIALYWKTDTTTYYYFPPVTKKKSTVSTIRVYMSESGPDENFYLIKESSKIGEDFKEVHNLRNDKVYYFRLATYDSKDSLLSLSNPLMTSPGPEKRVIYDVDMNQVEHPQYIKNLSWSPVENNLALIMADESNHANLYILTIGLFNMNKISEFSTDSYRLMGVSFSPDSKDVAYSYTASRTYGRIDYRIWTVNLSDHSKKSITSGRVDASPDWFSKDLVLFCKGSYDSPNIPQLYIKNLTDGSETLIPVDDTILKYTPDFHPQDSSIVYSGENEYARDIYMTNIQGDFNQNLTESTFWRDLHPHWSVNGNNVLFTSDRSGHFEVWSLNISTEKYHQVTHGTDYRKNRFYGKISVDQNYMAVIEYDQDRRYTLKILQN